MKQFFWLLVLILPLMNCQQRAMHTSASEPLPPAKQQTDAAPLKPKKVALKNAKPVAEPLSKYGNPSVYSANGKTYKVMTSAYGYRARGTASWYGTKFYKKRTSSGEPYDLYALTAAHNTLPLPTYVKVRHLENGREIIVKVNDRGPFHADRVIDLSYGAAVKLGILDKGTGPVEIEAISLQNKPHKANYYLQVGAFQSKNLAETLRRKLLVLLHHPIAIEPYKSYFIVKAGPFASQVLMQQTKNLLAKHGISGAFSLIQ